MTEHHLTNNLHVDVGSIFSSRIANHNRIDSLVLPLSPLNGEDTVASGALHMDPAVALCDHLEQQNRW